MKVFALIMLRCALIMLLCPLLQNGTLALGEWEKSCQELKAWETSYHKMKMVKPVSFWLGLITLDPNHIDEMIMKPLTDLLNVVNNFPIGGMKELLSRRLQKPLGLAIGNCDKLVNEVKPSGLEDNKKYLETLVSKTSSIANGIDKEFNTFIMEVELELFKKFYGTLQDQSKLANKLLDFVKLSNNSYSDGAYFSKEYSLLSIGMGNNPCYQLGTTEFDDFVESLILNAKLNILATEFNSKIAMFAQQQHLDWDGFMGFSDEFKKEWKQFEQQMNTTNIADKKIADTEITLRKRLDDLAESAMIETTPLKIIITKKFDQLMTKCLVSTKKKGQLKNAIKHFLGGSNKSKEKKQKEEAKKNEIDAMKEIISDIGMFDGAANKLLVRFEHEELDNNDFCAELKEAVAEDKEVVSNAYKVQQ